MNNQIHYKEKALLANQYKIEATQRDRNWIGRNWIKIGLFGIFMSIVGPVYVHQPDGIHRTKAITALDMSDLGHVGTGIGFMLIYIICMLIAHWTGNYQDRRKINRLQKERLKLQQELSQLKQLDNSK